MVVVEGTSRLARPHPDTVSKTTTDPTRMSFIAIKPPCWGVVVARPLFVPHGGMVRRRL